jgi:acyl-coenzyme A synthetase/AMP-(fatty) acid ligase
MTSVETFLQKISNHSRDSKIYFEDKSYTYKQIVDKSYDIARFIESQDYQKVFFNLKNTPLSFCLYIAGFIADIELLVPVNSRLIDQEMEQIIETNSLFFTYEATSEFKVFAKKNNIKTIEINNEIRFLEELCKTDDLKVFGKAAIAHVSSGTTGAYKKHPHSLNQIIGYANNRSKDLGLLEDDHLLMAVSVNFVFAFACQFLPAITMGLNVTMIREFSVSALLEIVAENNVTALALVPTMYNFLAKQDIGSHNLRYLGVAGDIVSEGLYNSVKKAFGLPLLSGIGMTEIIGYGQNASSNEYNNKIKIFDDAEVRIEKFKDSDYGIIFVKNNTLPLYAQNDWFDTGDIGSFDEQTRELIFYGRYKDIIIKGGSNISPVELESVILQLDNISTCVVVGKADKIWGETICGFVVGSNYSLDDINNHLIKFVAKYKKLDQLIQIEQMPLTSSGKVDRKKLKQLADNEY